MEGFVVCWVQRCYHVNIWNFQPSQGREMYGIAVSQKERFCPKLQKMGLFSIMPGTVT